MPNFVARTASTTPPPVSGAELAGRWAAVVVGLVLCVAVLAVVVAGAFWLVASIIADTPTN